MLCPLRCLPCKPHNRAAKAAVYAASHQHPSTPSSLQWLSLRSLSTPPSKAAKAQSPAAELSRSKQALPSSKSTTGKQRPVTAQSPPPQRPPVKAAPNAKSHSAPATKLGYPEQLLIYHAGNGRTIFISCFRLTSILLFVFSTFMVAPGYYFSPLEPTWMAAAIVVGGAIPLTIMVFTTAPFVTYVHLHLPTWARASSARLHRFAASLPSSTFVDITTLKWVWPRVTRLQAKELYLHRSELSGAMTLRRQVPDAVKEERRWYDWKPITKFYVAGKSGSKVPEQGVWEGVIGSVARGWSSPGQREKLLNR